MPDDKNHDREERVRARAYDLWQREGGSHGSHERHWSEASRQIDEESMTSSLGVVPGPEGAGKSKRATKPAKTGATTDLSAPAPVSPSMPLSEMPAKSGRPVGRPKKL
jgi:hypothetical protein